MKQPIPRKDRFTKILTFSGTFLVILPILAPVVFALLFLLRSGRFHFDYLMPAELFPMVLVGGILLIWAALRARSHLKLIGWSFGLMFAFLFGGQLIAVVSGLASGQTEITSPWWGVVLAALGGYCFLVILMAIGGMLLLRELFQNKT
jgi:hypothetical protein